MTSETLNLHVSKNLNTSKTKQDIEKLKTPLRLVWKCCSVGLKIGSTIFSLQGHVNKPEAIVQTTQKNYHVLAIVSMSCLFPVQVYILYLVG